jgi:hypothetical protein
MDDDSDVRDVREEMREENFKRNDDEQDFALKFPRKQ